MKMTTEEMADLKILWQMFYTETRKIQMERISMSGGKLKKSISKEELSRITSHETATHPAGARPVIFILDTPYIVFMTDEQMINFDQFVLRVKEVYPDCNQTDHNLWQHWTSIRSAFQKF
jgi:hypothetical protein